MSFSDRRNSCHFGIADHIGYCRKPEHARGDLHQLEHGFAIPAMRRKRHCGTDFQGSKTFTLYLTIDSLVEQYLEFLQDPCHCTKVMDVPARLGSQTVHDYLFHAGQAAPCISRVAHFPSDHGHTAENW